MIIPCQTLLSQLNLLITRCLSLPSPFLAESLHVHLLKLSLLHRSTFLSNRLLSLYSRLGPTPSTLRLFQEIPAKNTFTWNILLSAFSKTGCLNDACQVFAEMPNRDSVSWNCLISCYAANGLAYEAFETLHRMQQLGFKATCFTLSIAASWVSSVRQAKQVHGITVRKGFHLLNTVMGNSLVKMYGRVGLVGYACIVFRHMEGPDIVSWNSVISVCGNAGQGDKALDFFREMMGCGVRFDEFTVSTVISVCADAEDLAKGEQLLAQCFKMGFLLNSIVSSAVIDMYSKCGRLDEAVLFFREMEGWDSAVFNSMASAYARNWRMDEALSLFVAALRRGVRPTEFTFASILSSSSCFGLMDQGTQIHCWVVKLGLETDEIIVNALVDMHMKLGMVESALRIFSTPTAKDLISWNTMIMGLAQNGQGIEALRTFRELTDHGLRPDRISLVGVLSACSYEGMVNAGHKIFSLMVKRYGVEPGLEHYACMVDMMSRAGRYKEAMSIIETMPHKPTSAVWSLLLEACWVHGDLRIAGTVAEKMMGLEPRFPLPYTVLARLYGIQGKWESMARVWKTMKERNVKKVVGCSWIGIKNHVAVFTSDDILHCGEEATYSILHLMAWEMEEEGYVPEQHTGIGGSTEE